jgi:hypothetical protein
MKPVKTLLSAWVLFPFLFPVFYVLRVFRRFFPLVSVADCLQVAAGYLIGMGVAYAGVRIVLKDKMKAALMLVPVLLFYFFWSFYFEKILRFFPANFTAAWSIALAAAVVLILVCAFITARMSAGFRQRLFFFFNLLIPCYLLAEVLLVLPKIWKQNTTPSADLISAKQLPARKWSVFLIIFDEYASAKALNEYLHYNNSDIEDFLKNQGFSIQTGSFSNYNATRLSMASMLNMAYLPNMKSPQTGFADMVQSLSAIWGNAAMQTFADYGYRLQNYTIFDIKNTLRHIDNTHFILPAGVVFPSGKDAIRYNTLGDLLRKQCRISFHNGLPVSIGKPAEKEVYRANEQNIELFLKESVPRQEPQFSYLHILCPHWPYLFNKSGQLLPPDSAKLLLDNKQSPEFYTYNIAYANRRMKDMVSALMQHHRQDAAIIIMGDHGWRSFSNKNATDFFFRNLNAVYFPDRDYSTLCDSISNVNMMRVVLNKVLGTTLPTLADSMILLREQKGTPGVWE